MVDIPRSFIRRDFFFLTVAFVPFFFNDFFFIGLTDPIKVLGIDYVTRILGISILLFIPTLRLAAFQRQNPNEWRGAAGSILFVVYAVFITWFVIFAVELPLDRAYPSWNLFSYPKIEPPSLFYFDISMGLLLVAISEELLCRVVLFNVLNRHIKSHLLIIVISAAIFGLMHWSKGVGNMASTTLLGIFFMWGYIKSQSLKTVVAAHFAIDFMVFGLPNL